MKQSKVTLGLVNPMSPKSVGAVMRAAGNFCVDAVFYTGERYARAIGCNPDIPRMSRSALAVMS